MLKKSTNKKNNLSKNLTSDYHLVKHLNSHLILNFIRIDGPISGADLSKTSGMQPSTILRILRNLQRTGIIYKTGIGDSTKVGGRPPILWDLCENYGYVVGIQIELNEIRAVLLNLKSQVIAEKILKIDRFSTFSELGNKILEMIDIILHIKKISRRHLLGIGIGISGIVDFSTGTIIKTALLPTSQHPLHLGTFLEQHFDAPVFIDNDANAAALAEKWLGRAKGHEPFVFSLVIIDRNVFGIGFGLVLKDDLFRGANLGAGETKPYTLNIKKIYQLCNSNKELKINNRSISIDELEITHLLAALAEKDEIAIKFFKEVGIIIGKELVKILNLLDPKMIVIGGEASKAKHYLIDNIRKTIENDPALIINREFLLVESSTPEISVALGAASIILQKIFHGSILNNN